MREWEKLKVWKKAHQLVLDIYRIIKKFPREETHRLVDQLCRAAVSVPANIVEGQSRNTTKEYLSFLYNARGSHAEVGYHLYLANDLGYVNLEDYGNLIELHDEVGRMLNGLINSLSPKS